MTAARRTGEIAIGILPIALVIALWHGIAMSGIAPPVLLPPPSAVFARLIEQVGNPQYPGHMRRSRCSGCSRASPSRSSSASRSASRRPGANSSSR